MCGPALTDLYKSPYGALANLSYICNPELGVSWFPLLPALPVLCPQGYPYSGKVGQIEALAGKGDPPLE